MAGVPWTMCVRLLLTLALLQTARASGVRQRLYKRNAAMDGLQLTSTALFQASAHTTTHCGMWCTGEKCCHSFAFTAEQPLSCRGYHIAVSSSNAYDTVSATETKYFEHVIADWLGTPCSLNCECPVNLTECFKGQCLCSPGHYYSEGSKACFADCPQTDLRGGLIKYPDSAIASPSNLISETIDISLAACKDKCLNVYPTCRSFTYNVIARWCGLFPYDASTNVYGTYQRDLVGFDYHQKTCA